MIKLLLVLIIVDKKILLEFFLRKLVFFVYRCLLSHFLTNILSISYFLDSIANYISLGFNIVHEKLQFLRFFKEFEQLLLLKNIGFAFFWETDSIAISGRLLEKKFISAEIIWRWLKDQPSIHDLLISLLIYISDKEFFSQLYFSPEEKVYSADIWWFFLINHMLALKYLIYWQTDEKMYVFVTEILQKGKLSKKLQFFFNFFLFYIFNYLFKDFPTKIHNMEIIL